MSLYTTIFLPFFTILLVYILVARLPPVSPCPTRLHHKARHPFHTRKVSDSVEVGSEAADYSSTASRGVKQTEKSALLVACEDHWLRVPRALLVEKNQLNSVPRFSPPHAGRMQASGGRAFSYADS